MTMLCKFLRFNVLISTLLGMPAIALHSANAVLLASSKRLECTKSVCAVNKNSLDFFVVGDTGGNYLLVFP